MIKLVIEINEKRKIETNKICAVDIEVEVNEICKNASENEKKVSKLLKNRLNFSEEIQVENLSSINDTDILKEILKSI